ncbi:MAG: hypothetical protein J1F31_04260 [Erysipelotrichales bacterium]|nr:hypothetical protein [Erysipelotrichales bacterium]
MKHKLLLVALLLTLTSCGSSIPSISNSVSTSPDSTNIENSVSDPSNSNETSNIPTSNESSEEVSKETPSVTPSVTPPSISNSQSTPNELKELSIEQIRSLGKALNDNEVGDLVRFKATYLRTVTMSRSNEDLMYFADENSYIYLRVAYANYTGYLANRYTNQEYIVTANVAKVDGVIELAFNKDIGAKESVVNCGENVSTTVNFENVSEVKDSIISMVSDFESIQLNKKKSGSGKIVTFTGQLIATDREDANKKAVFSDGTGVISVIADEKKFVGAEDIGNYYRIIGIMNIEVTSPAILHLSSTFIKDEVEIDVSNAKIVEPDFLKAKYIIGDKYYSPSIREYLSLYKTTGYIVDNSKYNRDNYYLGIAKENKGSLISDSSSSSIKSVSGLFLMNHYNISERSFSYSPLYDYYISDSQIELYFTIHQFYSQDHGWKVFPIEAIVDSLN